MSVMGGLSARKSEELSLYDRFEACLKLFLKHTCKDLEIEIKESEHLYEFKSSKSSRLIPSKWHTGTFDMGRTNFLSLGHPLVNTLIEFISQSKYPLDKSVLNNRLEFFSSKYNLNSIGR